MLLSLVTDRVSGSYYTYTDLNRVGEAIQYLADLLNGYGYAVSINSKTDWAAGDIPRLAQATTYLANVQALIDTYHILPTTPNLPEDLEFLTWVEANDIEQILSDMKTLLENMIAAFRYCGDTYCGE